MTSTANASTNDVLRELGIDPVHSGAYAGRWLKTSGPELESKNPATGEVLGRVKQATAKEYETCVAAAEDAFLRWRTVPAPRRGEIVRRIGNELRAKKEPLGKLVTMEVGKILQEGLGEVQEMIDIADFAVGQSRMLYGLTMPSERPGHSMKEQWHPLGVVGVVTAFNFPAAVWAWNSMLAFVCGDACVWKPSPKAPLTAIARFGRSTRMAHTSSTGALIVIVSDDTVCENTDDSCRDDRFMDKSFIRGTFRLNPRLFSQYCRSLTNRCLFRQKIGQHCLALLPQKCTVIGIKRQ